MSTNTLGNAWIVGSDTNGLVGTNTATEGGGQQVVGGDGRVETIIRVVNPNNTFNEHFRTTDFKDTDQPNNASWDTTNFRIAMHTSSNHNIPYNTISTFKSIFLNEQTVVAVKVIATETRWNPQDLIKYFVSANGGGDWQEIDYNTNTVLTVTGTDLRLKILFWGNGGAETYIEDLKIEYTI